MNMDLQPSEILRFWFEDSPSVRRKKWFEKNLDFDLDCARFTDAVRRAREGHYDVWAATPRGGLALIILLDQLSRNIFRNSAEAFAADPHARQIARRMIDIGFDTKLTPFERMFVYLPFEHAETIEDQACSVRLFEPLRDALGPDTVDHAHRHRDVIQAHGRFPHRNAVLGRACSPEEEEYLARPGAGF
jgi:uncharacterized protein (DUF924 family)